MPRPGAAPAGPKRYARYDAGPVARRSSPGPAPALLSCRHSSEGQWEAGISDARAEHDRRIDYVELAVTDVEAAKRFYGDVFGWEFTDYGPDYC